MDNNNFIEELEDDIADELDEMKGSSMGDPSETAEPVGKNDKKNKSSIAMKGSAKGAKLKGVDKGPESNTVTKPSTKMESKYSIIANLIAEMQSMDHDQIVDLYNAVTNDDIESEGMDVQEEMKDLFGEDASEEFNQKASTLFEAAVDERVASLWEDYMIDTAANMEVEREEMMEEFTDKVDSYLDYTISEWLTENELAVEAGIKSEVVESFLGGIKDLMVEHYIDVPEDKVDVVEALADKVEDLEEQVNDLMDNNIELTEAVASHEKADVVEEFIDRLELTDTDAERLGVFAESINARSANEFGEKLSIICEHYFTEASDSATSHDKRVVLDEEVYPYIDNEAPEEAEINDPTMRSFVDAISRNAKF